MHASARSRLIWSTPTYDAELYLAAVAICLPLKPRDRKLHLAVSLVPQLFDLDDLDEHLTDDERRDIRRTELSSGPSACWITQCKRARWIYVAKAAYLQARPSTAKSRTPLTFADVGIKFEQLLSTYPRQMYVPRVSVKGEPYEDVHGFVSVITSEAFVHDVRANGPVVSHKRLDTHSVGLAVLGTGSRDGAPSVVDRNVPVINLRWKNVLAAIRDTVRARTGFPAFDGHGVDAAWQHAIS